MVNQELDTILPLVITSGNRIADVVLMNEKGYRKSIETGKLWTIHPKRGRLLPYEPKSGRTTERASAGFDRLTKGPRWYHAEVPENWTENANTNSRSAGTVAKPVREEEGDWANMAGGQNGFSDDFGRLEAYEQPRAGLEILTLLEAIIKERREAMPEGSYTTHLFESGLDKIRKKTGEEAVELILAEGREEIAHESADLIYHLLVLLEAAGVPLQAVLEELQNRSS
jgi:phosphoribosyl-ATP pyrophosphohydrolase